MAEKRSKEDRLVITGIGPLTAGGTGVEGVWSAIERKDTGLVQKKYEIGGEKSNEFYVHEIRNFDIRDYDVNKRILNEIKSWKKGDEIEDLYYFLAAISMAINDAHLIISEENKDMTGVILAHENIGLDQFYQKVISDLSFMSGSLDKKPETVKQFFDIFYEKFNRTGYELQTFMPLHHVAKMFDVHGYSLFLDNACASGLYALEAAAATIKSGRCRRMIIAAVDKSSVFKQVWFKNIDMCAKDGKIKPFAADRDGFTIGDGGAALILETMEDADRRKAKIYAEYVGSDFVLEGWKVIYPDVSGDLYKRMISRAIDSAGLKVSDVDLIIPHGVGTAITDAYEARAITDLFGRNKTRPFISAFKPYTGHTLGSTALLETAIMLIGLEKGKIPPTLNCENPDKLLGINLLNNANDADEIDVAIKTACGFAGFNAACLFKKVRCK